MEFPSWLEWLEWLVGSDWPHGNEDLMWQMGRDLEDVAGQVDDLRADLDHLLSGLGDAYPEGTGGEKIMQWLLPLRDGAGPEHHGSIKEIGENYRALAAAADGMGDQLQSAKLNFYIAGAWLIAELAWAAASGPFAPALEGTIFATARVMFRELGEQLANRITRALADRITNQVLKRIIPKLVYEIGQEAFVEALQGTSQEFLVQTIQQQTGHTDGYDWGAMGTNAAISAIAGGTGGAFGLGANHFLPTNMGGWRGSLNGALTGWGAGAAGAGGAWLGGGLLTGNWEFDPRSLTGGAFSGAGPSALHGYAGHTDFGGRPVGSPNDGTSPATFDSPVHGGSETTPGTPGGTTDPVHGQRSDGTTDPTQRADGSTDPMQRNSGATDPVGQQPGDSGQHGGAATHPASSPVGEGDSGADKDGPAHDDRQEQPQGTGDGPAVGGGRNGKPDVDAEATGDGGDSTHSSDSRAPGGDHSGGHSNDLGASTDSHGERGADSDARSNESPARSDDVAGRGESNPEGKGAHPAEANPSTGNGAIGSTPSASQGGAPAHTGAPNSASHNAAPDARGTSNPNTGTNPNTGQTGDTRAPGDTAKPTPGTRPLAPGDGTAPKPVAAQPGSAPRSALGDQSHAAGPVQAGRTGIEATDSSDTANQPGDTANSHADAIGHPTDPTAHPTDAAAHPTDVNGPRTDAAHQRTDTGSDGLDPGSETHRGSEDSTEGTTAGVVPIPVHDPSAQPDRGRSGLPGDARGGERRPPEHGQSTPIGDYNGESRTGDELDPDFLREEIKANLGLITPEDVAWNRDRNHFVLPDEHGTVSVRVGPTTDGAVAEFHARPDGSGYDVQVSPHARDEDVVRAVAHELAEIRLGLDSRISLDPDIDQNDDRPNELTPHLAGRFAELRVLTAQIDAATFDPARAHELPRLRSDLRALTDRLGLSDPAHTTPTTTAHADSAPTDSKPADTPPAEAAASTPHSPDTAPAHTDPDQTTPAQGDPARTTPADTGPAHANPARTGPDDTSSPRAAEHNHTPAQAETAPAQGDTARELLRAHDPELARRLQLEQDGALSQRPNFDPHLTDAQFERTAERHLAQLAQQLTGVHADDVVTAERHGLDGRMREEQARRLFDPLFEPEAKAARRMVPGLLEALNPINAVINDPNVSGPDRAQALHRALDAFENSTPENFRQAFGPDNFARMHAAADAFGQGPDHITGVLDHATGTLMVDGAPTTLGDFLRDIDSANRGAAENGINAEYTVVVHDAVDGKSAVDVLPRPQPQHRLPLQQNAFGDDNARIRLRQRPTVRAAVEGGHTVDVGVGRSAFAVDLTPEADRSGGGLIIKTELASEFPIAGQRRRDLGILDPGPITAPGSVMLFGNLLFDGNILAGPGNGQIARVYINNVSAELPDAAYHPMAAALADAMAPGGRIEVQWDMKPQEENGTPGDRGHILGTTLWHAIEAHYGDRANPFRVVELTHFEGAGNDDYDYTIDAGASNNLDTQRMAGFARPLPEHRMVIEYHPAPDPVEAHPAEIESTYGIPEQNQQKIQDYADQHNLQIDVRPTNPDAVRHLQDGAMPKPMAIKDKTVNDADIALGAPAEAKGLVGRFEPGQLRLPDPDTVSPEDMAKLQKRLDDRENDFEAYRDYMRNFIDQGKFRITEDGILEGRVGDDYRPVTGDHDLFDMRHADGTRLTPTELAEHERRLARLDAGIQHGPHLYWEPANEYQRARNYEKIIDEHQWDPTPETSHEPLIRFTPNQEPVVMWADRTMAEIDKEMTPWHLESDLAGLGDHPDVPRLRDLATELVNDPAFDHREYRDRLHDGAPLPPEGGSPAHRLAALRLEARNGTDPAEILRHTGPRQSEAEHGAAQRENTDVPQPEATTPDTPADRNPNPGEADRYGEHTDAGIAHHGDDPAMADLARRVPHDPNYFSADVHITEDGNARIGDRTYTPEQYADLVRRSDWDGTTPIRVIGCDAASNDFASRLSAALGVDVLAATKPVWTDEHGRVYTSTAEIGPDGNRRPRIPPDGEWQIHRPDGSRTTAAQDGFAPGTPEAHKHGLTPEGARDRSAFRDDMFADDEPHRRTYEDIIGDRPVTTIKADDALAPKRRRPFGRDERTGLPIKLDADTAYRVTDRAGRDRGLFVTGPDGHIHEVHTDSGRKQTRDTVQRRLLGDGFNPDLKRPFAEASYRVDDRFQYTTDAQGRVVVAHGKLDLFGSDEGRRGPDQTPIGHVGGKEYAAINKDIIDQFTAQFGRTPSLSEVILYAAVTFDGGHLFGTEFGGPGEAINMVPMLTSLNQDPGETTPLDNWRKLEGHWEHLLGQDPPPVLHVRIDLDYDPHSPNMKTPAYIDVEYLVDGVLVDTLSFKNIPPRRQ